MSQPPIDDAHIAYAVSLANDLDARGEVFSANLVRRMVAAILESQAAAKIAKCYADNPAILTEIEQRLKNETPEEWKDDE
jgi:hypothetical protein